MLLVKTIVIYSDKDYWNNAIQEKWVEVGDYTYDEVMRNTESKMKEIAKKLTDKLWDLETWGEEPEIYEHNGEFSNRGYLWEMPKDLADNFPCDKVIVGVSGSWVGLPENKVEQYQQLISNKSHHHSIFKLKRFILRGEENE